jgi:hypothetical protein
MARSLLAATIVATRQSAALFRSVLECSLPHATWGQAIEPSTVAAAHRLAWEAASDVGKAWIHSFLAEPVLERKLELLIDGCTDPDEGSQAVAQLIANEPPARAAAFAFAAYPAGLSGRLPIGAEGVNDLAKLAVPMMDAAGEISWQERLNEKGTSHPVIAAIGKVLAPLDGSRKARARQFLVSCVVRGIQIESPADLETQIHACVELLRARGLVEAAAVGVEATGLVDAAVVGAAASRGGAVASGAAGLGDAVTGDAAFMGGGVKGGAA